ncbi:MAG: hypothetical protein KBA31_14235 [Alphaproteobacteria bacterium]|nr:hypothetical protein [Alphaproteobacteria bacterium]
MAKLTGRPVHSVYFQGRRQDLPVHTVSIDFPKYRLDNGRTRSAQAAYLAQHPDMRADLFESDLESESAQKAQHELLRTMLGGGEKDLLRFFSTREQMQPFILTDMGFVLNGNRRLCAFRELVLIDKALNEPKFSNIEVVFLPPADERELDKLEALYQLTEDIKEAYSWTARAYMLRVRQKEHGFDNEELSSIYQLAESEVSDLLGMLSLAEEYLDERGKPNQFVEVDGDEFAFRQLLKARVKLENEAERDAVQELAFCVIEKWDEGRLYAVIPRLAENLPEIRSAVVKEFPAPPKTKTSEAASLLGMKTVTVDPVTTVLSSVENRDKVREIIADVLEVAAERKREAKRGNRVITRLSRAHELIVSALADWDKAADKKAVASKIDDISLSLGELRKKADSDGSD